MSMDDFDNAMQELRESHSAGKAFQVKQARESALPKALYAMAQTCGARLERTHVNANGELMLIAAVEGRPRRFDSDPCGNFGESFARWLNEYGVRIGGREFGYESPLHARSGWCYMNHLAAEQMVTAFAAAR